MKKQNLDNYIPLTIGELTEGWLLAKKVEQDANQRRLTIERQIVALCELPEKGTTTLPTGLKVVTGYTEKWDQQVLDDAAGNWTSELPFPFKTEYKPVKALLDIIEVNDTHKYKELQKAVTVTPSKPSFSFKE